MFGSSSFMYFCPSQNSDRSATVTLLFPSCAILYRLTETATRDGYTLLKDPVYTGTLPANGDSGPVYDVSATIRDGSVFGLPMTGSSGFAPQMLGILLLIPGCGLVYAAIHRKKNALSQNLFYKENLH